MSYLALYRKYRPQNFEDVVGQDKIIKVINNAILNEKISHAYLFSGPRGTGKTTTAKIIAKMVNCQNLTVDGPCNKCENCINFLSNNDIVEIDAASNNGVDEIRELRDKVNLVPSNSRYKVYIIDEVHMLTTSAFNALLKTLEEPPRHVIFILATTEPYKIPLTVASRCQKFQFNKIDDDSIVKKLKQISNNEEIDITEEAMYEISRLADGGLRDAINLLDQLTAYKTEKITIEDVYKVNGSVSYRDLYGLLISIKNNDKKNIIQIIENIDNDGKNISKFIEELLIFLKDVLIFKNCNRKTKIEDKNKKIEEIILNFDDDLIYLMINRLNDVLNLLKTSSYPSILLLINLLKLTECKTTYEQSDNIFVQDNQLKQKRILLEEKVHKENNFTTISTDNLDKIKKIRINNSFVSASKQLLNIVKEKWSTISEYLLDKRYELAVGLLADAVPTVVGKDDIILVSKYISSATRINVNKEEVENLLNKVYNKKYNVVAISEEEWTVEKKQYIENIKKGYKYEYINEEKKEFEKFDLGEKSQVDKLIELVGEEIIEYK